MVGFTHQHSFLSQILRKCTNYQHLLALYHLSQDMAKNDNLQELMDEDLLEMLTEDILNTLEVEGVEVPTNEQPDRDEEPLYTGCL